MSRTGRSIRNLATSYLGDIVAYVLKFVVRTAFIYSLGKEYVGVNGLFTSLLSMLSMAELGLGSALNFKLYQSLQKGDDYRTSQLVKFYRAAFFSIGLFIALVGVCLIPALPAIIKDYNQLADIGVNAVLIYLMYLFQTVSSYWFFAYRSAIIRADQKEYVINVTTTVVTTISSVVQIILLYAFSDIMVYTFAAIVSTILSSVIVACLSKRMYPNIKHRNVLSLSKADTMEMIKDCGAVFIFKINAIVVNATDNVILSSTLGMGIVGVYSNYLLVINLLRTLATKFFNAITASFGNLHAEGNTAHEYELFKVIHYCTFVMYSIVAVWIYSNFDFFIKVWIGESYLAEATITIPLDILLAIEIYLAGTYSFLSRIRNACGLFRQVIISPIIAIFINLFVSLILAPRIGIAGVVIGTIVSGLCTFAVIDPVIIYRCVYKTSSVPFFIRSAAYVAVTIVSCAFSKFICEHITFANWYCVILRSVICAVVAFLFSLCAFFRTREFIYLKNVPFKFIKNVIKRNKRQSEYYRK